MARQRHGEIYRRQDGDFGWRVISKNNNQTSVAVEGFGTKARAERALKREHPDLPIVDKTTKSGKRTR